MKKAVFMLGLIISSIATVSCTTDAYDLPETDALKSQPVEEQFDFASDGNYSNYSIKDGEEESTTKDDVESTTTTTVSDDNTEPVIIPPKRD